MHQHAKFEANIHEKMTNGACVQIYLTSRKIYLQEWLLSTPVVKKLVLLFPIVTTSSKFQH